MKKQKFTFTVLVMLVCASLGLKGQNCAAAFEPNNSLSAAVTITPNSMLYAAISNGSDVDYYKVLLPNGVSGQVLSVSLGGLDRDYDMYLYNPSGVQIGYSGRVSTFDEQITYYLPPSGGYYSIAVVPYAQSSSTKCYRLSNAVYSGTNACTSSQSFIYATRFGCINSSSDVDYHSVYADKTCTIQFQLSAARDYDFQVYNQSGSIIASGSASAQNLGYTSINAPTSGNYTVKVYGRNGANGPEPYVLHVNRIYSCTYSMEPNDNMSTARAFSYTNYLYSGIESTTDVDWYKITISSPSTINATLSSLPLDYDLDLYNSAGNYLANSALGGTQNETITYYANQTGTYYLKVYGYNGAYDPACYRIGASIGSARNGEDGIEIEEVANPFDKASVEVYPNPIQVNGELNVNMGNRAKDGNFTTRIIGMDGAIISEQEIVVQSGRSSVNISGIKPGIYMLDLGDAGKHKLVIK